MPRILPSIGRTTLLAATLCGAAFVLLTLSPGCDRESTVGPHDPLKLSAALVEHSECKGPSPLPEGSADLDCAKYQYLPGDTLLLTHVNAAFNCCPGDLIADITLSHDTITIAEHDAESGCRCLCLYDVSYRITDLPAGTYTIRFIEPYLTDADPPLMFTADLAASPTDSLCFVRHGYPYSNDQPEGPYGLLLSHSGCKTNASAAAVPPIEYGYQEPDDMSCIDWSYDLSGGLLTIKHVNAAFNCCAGDIAADISISDGTITIVEREEGPTCRCTCLYDLEFQIWDLGPGVYRIKIVEPYVRQGDQTLDFAVDLSSLPAGIECVYRGHDPWTYEGTMAGDRAVLEAMRRGIVDVIGTPSCGATGDCRYIGLGVKPCGGVWEYLVYSAATVDQAKLKYLVMLYNAFDDGYNRRYHVFSDCMIVTPPTVGCVEGVCKALGSTSR